MGSEGSQDGGLRGPRMGLRGPRMGLRGPRMGTRVVVGAPRHGDQGGIDTTPGTQDHEAS